MMRIQAPFQNAESSKSQRYVHFEFTENLLQI